VILDFGLQILDWGINDAGISIQNPQSKIRNGFQAPTEDGR